MADKIEFRIAVSNEPGSLWRICDALHKNGVNIRTIAGIAGQDILAVVTDQERETRKVFQNLGLKFEEIPILILKVSNIPGEIAYYSKKLTDSGINIDSIYMVGETSGKGEMVFAVDDIERAKRTLGFI